MILSKLEWQDKLFQIISCHWFKLTAKVESRGRAAVGKLATSLKVLWFHRPDTPLIWSFPSKNKKSGSVKSTCDQNIAAVLWCITKPPTHKGFNYTIKPWRAKLKRLSPSHTHHMVPTSLRPQPDWSLLLITFTLRVVNEKPIKKTDLKRREQQLKVAQVIH